MISHNFPVRDIPPSIALSQRGGARSFALGGCSGRVTGRVRFAWSAGYGPLRGQLHAAAGLQGTRFHPWFVSLGTRPRRLRGPLLLPGAGSSGDRRGRECTDGGDRGADRSLYTV